MNKVLFVATALATAFLTTACNVSLGDKKSEEATVNGKSAADYYGQFVTADDKTLCAEAKAATADTTYLSGSNSQTGRVDLVLLRDGSYLMNYRDGNEAKTQKGAWSVSGVNLSLDGIATGSGVIFNDVPAVTFTFQSPQFGTNLNGRSVTLFRETSRIHCTDGDQN